MKRIEVHFSGRVQGVGFRYTTLKITAGYCVTGFVENLPDRRVRLVAEGNPDQLDGFISEIRERMGSNILDVEVKSQDSTGEFSAFRIRR